jgi:hypothetical protein
MTCADNGTEYCGAGSRLNVYQRGNGTIPGPTTTTSGTTTTPTATGGPQIKQTIGNWAFQGCWTEATNGRALASTTFANDSMTLESCASFCTGFKMFGVEYGRKCMCSPFTPMELTDSELRLLRQYPWCWECQCY